MNTVSIRIVANMTLTRGVALQATLLGLWLVPAIISVYFHFWRFVGVWAIFSGMTGYILYSCTSKRIEKTTPRRVGALWRPLM